jgi:two-component system response regulator
MSNSQLEIILIEDNLSDAKLTIMALKETHLANNITHLKDGAEALDYIFCTGPFSNRKPDNSIGLILLDLKMPKVNGIEVLRRLKADDSTKNIPVAVFTSSSEDPDVKECYRLGVNSYVIKPLDFLQLGTTIRNTGLYWMLTNHLPDI